MKRNARTCAFIFMFGMMTIVTPVAADDIPTFETLSCEKDCPPHTNAKPLTTPVPSYPDRYLGTVTDPVEGLADIYYTVGTDGSVKDAKLGYLLGPPEFGERALAVIRTRKFEPATEAGRPVEENHRVRFMFRMHGQNIGAREAVVTPYMKARRLGNGGDKNGAISILKELSNRAGLNFYERTMVAYALALLEAQTGDALAARAAIRIATLDEGGFLDTRTRSDAIRLRIKLEAANGDFAESFAWFEILKKGETVRAGDEIAQLVASLHTMIDSPQPLAMDAVIPTAGESTDWEHVLLRRSFEFHKVEGKLEKFELRCDHNSIRSPITESANWSVPNTWSGCVLVVSGTPGTKFQFFELQPLPNATK